MSFRSKDGKRDNIWKASQDNVYLVFESFMIGEKGGGKKRKSDLAKIND